MIPIAGDLSKNWKYRKPAKAQSTNMPEKKNGLNISRVSSVYRVKAYRRFLKKSLTLFFQIRRNLTCLCFQVLFTQCSLDPKSKKSSSSGVDYGVVRHTQLAVPLIEQYLALLFQMIQIRGQSPCNFLSGK